MLEEGIITGRQAFVEALREALRGLGAEGCRELCWLDVDFTAWPLSELGVLEALTHWALPHRRLKMLAAGYEELRRQHPRFVDWRRRWDHVVQAGEYQCEDLGAGNPAGLLLAPGRFSLRLLDAQQWRAVYSVRSADEIAAREWFDAVWQRSAPSFAAGTLGL